MEAMNTQLQDIKECCSNNGSSNTVPAQLNPAQLLNAVPNPASASSTINYFVPTTARTAKIQLAYSNGTVMQTIPVSSFGYSSTIIPTANLSSGTYYYSLIVDDQLIDTQKLSIILK
jgi:hypothetical protein